MKQITRAAALSIALAGILSASFNLRTVSASENGKKQPAVINGSIPPACPSNSPTGCGIWTN